MSRGGPRKGFGGPQPNSGRKPTHKPKKPWPIRLSDEQIGELKLQGGAPWFGGILNLLRTDRPEAFALLLIDALAKKHGPGFLAGLAGKINERVKNGS